MPMLIDVKRILRKLHEMTIFQNTTIGATAYVINLDDAIDRMREMEKRLAKLEIGFERLPASAPDNLLHDKDDPFWDRCLVPLSVTEKSCFDSHFRLWHRIASQDRPSIILEDDVLLSSDLAKSIATWQNRSDLDMIQLETVLGRKTISKQHHHGLRELIEDDLGSGGYLLWPTGAEKLLAMSKDFVSQVDMFLIYARTLERAQADPALVLQARLGALCGVDNAEQFESQIKRAPSRKNKLTKQGLRNELRNQRLKLGRRIRKRQNPKKFERKVIGFDGRDAI